MIRNPLISGPHDVKDTFWRIRVARALAWRATGEGGIVRFMSRRREKGTGLFSRYCTATSSTKAEA